jgi:hypothetical protein
MPYYAVANLVTVTKTIMINEMPCGCGTLRTTGVRIRHQVSHRPYAKVSAALEVSHRPCTEVSVAPEVSHRPAQRSQQLQNLTILIVNLVPSWMHLHHSRRFQKHVRMLLQSFRALCKAPGGGGSIWKYLEAVVSATGVSGRFAYGFRTKLHFADVAYGPWLVNNHMDLDTS